MGHTLLILAGVVGGAGLGIYAFAHFTDSGTPKSVKTIVIIEGVALFLLVASGFFPAQ